MPDGVGMKNDSLFFTIKRLKNEEINNVPVAEPDQAGISTSSVTHFFILFLHLCFIPIFHSSEFYHTVN